jgi:hypothetical protein
MILYLVNARTYYVSIDIRTFASEGPARHRLTVCNGEHLGEVICTSCDNVLSIGTPSDIVDFLLRYATTEAMKVDEEKERKDQPRIGSL